MQNRKDRTEITKQSCTGLNGHHTQQQTRTIQWHHYLMTWMMTTMTSGKFGEGWTGRPAPTHLFVWRLGGRPSLTLAIRDANLLSFEGSTPDLHFPWPLTHTSRVPWILHRHGSKTQSALPFSKFSICYWLCQQHKSMSSKSRQKAN